MTKSPGYGPRKMRVRGDVRNINVLKKVLKKLISMENYIFEIVP